MKLKAAQDSDAVVKLLVVARFAAENKLAASHFHYAKKTESVEIRTVSSGWPY